MKRIAVLTILLAVVSTGVALAGDKPASDCTCQVAKTAAQTPGLSEAESVN